MIVIVLRDGSFRRALGEALVEAGENNNNIVVLDADTPKSTGTLAFARKFPERFINVGISEQDLVGTAAGIAIGGKTPVAAAFAMFLMRGWEQIRNTIARDKLNVKLVGTHAGLSDYMDGASHQSLEDLALMRTLPGFTVLSPSTPVAARKLVLEAVLEHDGPIYIRLGRENAPNIYSGEEEFRIGEAKVLVDPDDVVIFATGPILGAAYEALRILRRQGISAGLVDVYTIKPLDKETIIKQSARANLVVSVEEHSIHGGLGSAIAEALSEHAPKRVMRIGVEDSFGSSARSYQSLLSYMELTPEKIASRIRGALK